MAIECCGELLRNLEFNRVRLFVDSYFGSLNHKVLAGFALRYYNILLDSFYDSILQVPPRFRLVAM